MNTHTHSNSQSVVPLLDGAVSRTYRMLEANAYTHQYSMYGVDAPDIEDALIGVQQVLFNYQSL